MALAQVIGQLWPSYAREGGGMIEMSECKQLVREVMQEVSDNSELNDADFSQCFKEADEDGCGALTQDQTAKIIKRFVNV